MSSPVRDTEMSQLRTPNLSHPAKVHVECWGPIGHCDGRNARSREARPASDSGEPERSHLTAGPSFMVIVPAA